MKLGRQLFGNAGIYLGANIVNAGIPFLLLPILTRLLTPTDYGTVAMFSIALSVFGAFSGLSVHGAVAVRYFQLNQSDLAEYVGTCVGILVVSTSLLFILVVFLRGPLSAAFGVPIDWLLVAVVTAGFQFLGHIRLSLWQSSGNAKEYGVFQISRSLTNAAASLFFILFIGMAWQGSALGQALAIILFGVLAGLWLAKDRFLKFPRLWKVHARDALKFGVPLIPHAIGGLLIVAVDRLVITHLIDVAQAGIYMVALQIGQVLGLFTDSFNRAYAPWLMKALSQPTEARRVNIVRGTYAYFVALLLGALALGLLAPQLLAVLVGDSFQLAGELVIYIAVGFAFGGCYYVVANYVFIQSKTAILPLVTLASGVFHIPLTFLLVGRYGITGAGQAFMVTQALSFIGTWWLANKVYPMPWFGAFRRTSGN